MRKRRVLALLKRHAHPVAPLRRGGLGIKEGAVVRTPDTLYMGFGFEGISGTATRNDVMKKSVDYLLR
jgi:hypothetical protein